MRQTFRVISILLCCYAAFSFNSTQAASTSIRALHLKQIHCYFGNIELWFSATGLRFQSDPKQGFALIARAPDWSVTAFRQDDRAYYRQTLESFLDSGLVSNIVLKNRGHYEMEACIPVHNKFMGFDTAKIRYGRDAIEYMSLPVNVPRQEELLLHAVTRLPTNGGITIGYTLPTFGTDILTGRPESGADRQMLKTTAIRWEEVPVSLFEPPTNFKKVTSFREITTNASSKADVKEMLDGMDGK